MANKKFLTLKEIQYEEKEMLKELVNFFDVNNFEYFIWAGTFLGAVRHQGFIPWDDDIDLAMTRPEYNKFLEYLKEHDCKISDKLEVIGLELNNSDFPLLKVINKNIMVDEEEACDEYLWIDIFPLDAVPENSDNFLKKAIFLNKIFYLKRQQHKKIELVAANKLKKFLKGIFLSILGIWKYDNFVRFYLKYCTKYNYDDFEFVHNNVWFTSTAIYSKKDLVIKKYKFEDIMVNGVENYHDFLSKGYGENYMKLPPEEKRVTHKIKAWKIER